MMKTMAKQSLKRNPTSPQLSEGYAGHAKLRQTGALPRARKALGQNFLMHQAIADRIADTAHLSKKDTVLEIGPGTGMLTRALLARAGTVIAVEADAELIPRLEETFATEVREKRLRLILADIRTFDTASLPKGYALVANIPYYLTGELFRTFLTAKNKPSRIVFLVQKEVAARIARSKKESLLSLSVKAYGTPKLEFNVPRGAFVPAPNVDSAVLAITDISGKNFNSAAEENRFFEILHAGFAHKRKKLIRNLELIKPRGVVEETFDTLHLDKNARSEDLSLTDWLTLTKNV